MNWVYGKGIQGIIIFAIKPNLLISLIWQFLGFLKIILHYENAFICIEAILELQTQLLLM